MRRMVLARRSTAAAALALVLLVLTAGPASAHTKLGSSSPAAGATVTELRSIELRFTEGIVIEASHVYIKDAAGYLDLSPVTHIGDDTASLTVPVPALGEGTYEVTWHTLAEDGDPAQDTFSFTIAAPAAVVGRTAGHPGRPRRRLPARRVAGHRPRRVHLPRRAPGPR